LIDLTSGGIFLLPASMLLMTIFSCGMWNFREIKSENVFGVFCLMLSVGMIFWEVDGVSYFWKMEP